MKITDLGGLEDFLHGKKDTKKGCVIIEPNGEIIVPDPEEYKELAGEEPGKREETAPDSGDGRQGDPSVSELHESSRPGYPSLLIDDLLRLSGIRSEATPPLLSQFFPHLHSWYRWLDSHVEQMLVEPMGEHPRMSTG